MVYTIHSATKRGRATEMNVQSIPVKFFLRELGILPLDADVIVRLIRRSYLRP